MVVSDGRTLDNFWPGSLIGICSEFPAPGKLEHHSGRHRGDHRSCLVLKNQATSTNLAA